MAPHWVVTGIKGKDGCRKQNILFLCLVHSVHSPPQQRAVTQKAQALPGPPASNPALPTPSVIQARSSPSLTLVCLIPEVGRMLVPAQSGAGVNPYRVLGRRCCVVCGAQCRMPQQSVKGGTAPWAQVTRHEPPLVLGDRALSGVL